MDMLQIKEKSLCVVNVVENSNNSFGDIIVSNMTFRKKFGLYRDGFLEGKQSVSDLLFDSIQK